MTDHEKKGPIAWMARNPVPANLLMIFFLVGGLITSTHIRQEIFPSFQIDTITVSVAYPGAAPTEVEEGVILPVEDAVSDIEGVKRVTSTAFENAGTVFIELLAGTDGNKALTDIKNAVDRLRTLPEEAERPNISLVDARRAVLEIFIYGERSQHTLRSLAEKVRDDLLQRDKITSVELSGVPSPEISVEIPRRTLRKYNLKPEDVAARIRASSMDISGGSLDTEAGEILLRVNERKNYGLQLAAVPILESEDGNSVALGEIARIIDGFEETDEAAYFNGHPAVILEVSREGDQTPMEVSQEVRDYISRLKTELPEGISVSIFNDRSDYYKDRLNLLLKNALWGFFLVLALLGLFLQPRLAFWVTLGIPTSFLGGLMMLPSFDASINMVSLFAFILTLGIVVDDAIVIGENIYTLRRGGMDPLAASVEGVRQVALPVVLAVLTNIIAFLPLLFVEGVMGKIFRVVPIVAGAVFTVSLIEVLLILPSHLGHSKDVEPRGLMGFLGRLQNRFAGGVEWFIANIYRPALRAALENRYLTVAVGISAMAVLLGYAASGRIAIRFFHEAESDRVECRLEMPAGTPLEKTVEVQSKIVKAARGVLDRLGGDEVYLGIASHIGGGGGSMMGPGRSGGGNTTRIQVYLVPVDKRDFTGRQFAQWWREAAGPVPGVETMRFETDLIGPSAGKPVNVQLSHGDNSVLERAAARLADSLRKFPEAKDIDDGFSEGKPRLDFKLKPVAYGLGLTPSEVGRQIRSQFYGAEALRLQRGRNEVKVMVRLPERERGTRLSLEKMVIISPGGGEIPLDEIAAVKETTSYKQINRIDGRRVLEVTADTTTPEAAGRILRSLRENELPELQGLYPGLTYELGGERRDISESMGSIIRNSLLALVFIYLLLGLIFRSYIQPVVIMLAIPFGIFGAVLGHILMGFNLSVISFMGIAALSGVVINDSLILMDYANRKRREGADAFEAIHEAGARRFRPVILTTLTTFLGLTPMIFETSPQAKMLVPMAISLGFGELFSTMMILLLVPSFYLIVEDAKGLVKPKPLADEPAEPGKSASGG